MSSSRSAIKLRGVGVAYPLQRRMLGGSYWALDHVDLDLNHGDKLGIVGRNGAGKSTLLRVLSGALIPDRGQIERSHGTVQLLAISLGFISGLTGRDNAMLSGLLQGLRRAEIRARLDAIREFSELGEFFDRPLNTYSSGMVSRLGFAVAMQLEPDILLIDETLSVGDADFRAKSGDALLRKFSGDHTVVLVSHDEATMLKLCDRLLWIEHGRTVMLGNTKDVLAAYLAALAGPPAEVLPADATAAGSAGSSG
jgi:lipopolysaccharide transport system ATP-binding protein